MTKVKSVSTPYTLWFPRYSQDNILKVKVTTARSKFKSRSHDVAHLANETSKNQLLHLKVSEIWPRYDFKGQGHTSKVIAYLHPLTNVPNIYHLSYTLQFLRYSLDKILKVKVTTERSKVKSRSHHDVAHLHPNQCSWEQYMHSPQRL